MRRYSVEPRTRKYVKGNSFFCSRKISLTNIEKINWILLQKHNEML